MTEIHDKKMRGPALTPAETRGVLVLLVVLGVLLAVRIYEYGARNRARIEVIPGQDTVPPWKTDPDKAQEKIAVEGLAK